MSGPTRVGFVDNDDPGVGSFTEKFIRPDIHGGVCTDGKLFIQKLDYAGSGGLASYQGWAQPGTATTGSTWRICQFKYTDSRLTDIIWADGNTQFDNAWDARTSQTYT